MQIYKLAEDAFVMGEKNEIYGWSYRATSHDSNYPLQWSSTKTGFVKDVSITADKADLKTAKTSGKQYLWLTGVKIGNSGSQGGGDVLSSPTATNEPKAAAASSNYLKDASTVPLDVYRVRANINGLPSNETERRQFFENIMADSNELLRLIDNVRSGASDE